MSLRHISTTFTHTLGLFFNKCLSTNSNKCLQHFWAWRRRPKTKSDFLFLSWRFVSVVTDQNIAETFFLLVMTLVMHWNANKAKWQFLIKHFSSFRARNWKKRNKRAKANMTRKILFSMHFTSLNVVKLARRHGYVKN